MPLFDQLLQIPHDGIERVMLLSAKIVRQELDATKKKYGGAPYSAQDWQHLANALAYPKQRTTNQMKKLAKFLKSKFIQDLFYSIDQHIENCRKCNEHDHTEEFIASLRQAAIYFKANWDWQMFANGLLADD